MIATKSFEANTLEELGNQIVNWQNENKLVSKGSIPFGFNLITQKYGVICFYELETSNVVATSKEVGSDRRSQKADTSQSANPPKKDKSMPSEAQATALEFLGYNQMEIGEMTSKQAWEIINKSKSKNSK